MKNRLTSRGMKQEARGRKKTKNENRKKHLASRFSPASCLLPRVSFLFFLIFLSLMSCSSQNFDSEYRSAEESLGIGKTQAAITSYKHIIKKFPNDERRAGVIFKLAEIYENMQGDDESAMKEYTRLIDDHPLTQASVLARERRAYLFEKKGNFEGAIADYSSLLKHFSVSSEKNRWRVLLAGAYLAGRNFEQARIEALPLLTDKSVLPEVREQALFIEGESFFLEGKAEAAIAYYQELLKLFPDSKLASEAELHMATCVEELGYLGTARDITRDAGRDYPNQNVIKSRLKSLNERGTK